MAESGFVLGWTYTAKATTPGMEEVDRSNAAKDGGGRQRREPVAEEAKTSGCMGSVLE